VSSSDSYAHSGRVWLDIVQDAAAYSLVIRRRFDEVDSQGPRFGLCLYNAGMGPYEGCATGGC
jgi:hypothetical protein